jgi:hypothetical protein
MDLREDLRLADEPRPLVVREPLAEDLDRDRLPRADIARPAGAFAVYRANPVPGADAWRIYLGAFTFD